MLSKEEEEEEEEENLIFGPSQQSLIQIELVVSRQKIKMWKSNDDRQQLLSDGKCSHSGWHGVWSVEIKQVSLMIKKKKT